MINEKIQYHAQSFDNAQIHDLINFLSTSLTFAFVFCLEYTPFKYCTGLGLEGSSFFLNYN